MALHYNLSRVYEISENDPDFVLQIVRLFLDEIPFEFKLLKKDVEEKEFTKAYHLAHKMKPTFEMLGMVLAHEEIVVVENWCKNSGKRKEIKGVIKNLQMYIDAAVKELKKDFKTFEQK
jgi:HPt (histidine-containing phosphotransfer) domain-containing protein